MKTTLLILAAGGTGGHVPCPSACRRDVGRGWRVKLATDPRGARYVGGFPDQAKIEINASATFCPGGVLSKFLTPFF